MKFRVHHILCTSLYQGYGYSGPFCENMTMRVNWLKSNLDAPLQLTTHPDDICSNCPNLNVEDNTCSGNHNHVHIKDEQLLIVLGLKENEMYSYRELLETGLSKINKKEFDESCANCEWYLQGLCSYEAFVSNVKNIIE